MSRTRWRLVAASSCIAIAGISILFLTRTKADLPAIASKTDQPVPTAGSQPNLPASEPKEVSASTGGLQQTQFSLATKVRELSNSSSPTDAFRAYNILIECKWAKEEERAFKLTREAERDPIQVNRFKSGEFTTRITQACGDLKDVDINQRLALVERAAAAGVPLAAIQLTNEGPWGDMESLYARPQDPQVLEWRQKVSSLIHLAASKGDVAALTSMASQYATGSGVIGKPDPKLALKYAVAQNLVYEAQTGKPLYGRDQQLKALTARLSSEAAAEAKTEGEAFASLALGRK